MAIADLPDELHEYVPTLEDEGTNADAPVDPMLAPDDDPNVLELDEPETAGVSVEDAVIEDPEGFDAGFGLIESRESDLPVYAQGDAAALALEIDPAIESTLDDDGDIYNLTDGSPSDVAWAAAVDLAPALGTVDEPEFDDEPISLPEDEEAAEQIVPIQYEIQGRSLTAEWHTLATVAADKTSAEVAGLPTEDNWSFRVRAIYPNGLTGDWSAETDVNLPTDLLAPPVPSAPTLTAGRGIITVHWDGKGANGEVQPADYQHTAVWVSTSGEIGTWTIAGLLFADGGNLPYTFAGYNTPYYFSLSSRDLVGNESARSATADTKLRPLIEEPDIQAEFDRLDEEYDGVITEARQLGERLRDAEEEQVLHGEIINELETVELPGLKQRLSDAEAEIADQNTELNSRLADAEAELVAHDATIVNLETVKLPALTKDLDANEAVVSTLKNTTIPALNTRLGKAESELSTARTQLNNRLGLAETELIEHEQRMASSEAELAEAQSSVSAALTGLSTLRDTDLPALNARLGSAESEVDAAQASLDALAESVIPTLESSISGAQARLGAAESEITGTKTRITEAESDLTDAFKKIGLAAADAATAQKSANEAKQDAITKSEAARVAAIAEAETIASAKAATAVSDATSAAATDAKAKADAAQAAAIKAAKTATDLAASGAKQGAIDAAKADAKTKADAAQAAAIAAAASDATAKANKAKADATTAAANDATAKANNAKADAIAAASSDATAKANSAKTDAVAAATTMTNGIGKNLSSTAAPTTSNAAPNGSVWRRTDSSGRVIGSWEQTGAGIASTWTPRLIRSEVIDNVDIGKLSASSATINTVVVNKMAAQVATVIELNADRITAGAIKASQIDASSLAVAIASVIQLNASKITAGTISVDRLNVSSLAASIANVISLNASKITAGTISAARLDVNDLAVRIANVIELNASKINAGTINTSRLDTAAIAAATASIQKADIKNLTASNGTFSAAVIEKLWADVITARKIVADQLLIGQGENLIPWDMTSSSPQSWEHIDSFTSDGVVTQVTDSAGVSAPQHLYKQSFGVTPGISTITWRIGRKPFTTIPDSGWSVLPGDEYVASAFVKAGGNYEGGRPNVRVDIYFYNSSGTYIANTGSAAQSLNYVWDKVSVSAKAPATAAYCLVYMRQDMPGGVRIDMPSLYLKKDGSLIVTGSITGDHLEVNSVAAKVATVIELNADRVNAGTLNTARLNTSAIAAATAAIQKADIKNLTVSSGTFSAAVIEKLWADVITARKIYAEQILVGSGANLIVDPHFRDAELNAIREAEANGASSGTGWYWAGEFWYTKNGIADGTHLFRLRNTRTGSVYEDLAIEPGARYRFRWDAFLTGSSATNRMAFRIRKQDGSWRYAGANGDQSMKSGWATYTEEWTPEADDVSFCIEVQFKAVTNATRLAVRNVSVVAMTDGSLIVNGSVDAKAINSSSVSAEVAKFINLDVSRLVATSANLSEAVIEKLWADVVHAKKITADMVAIGAGSNLFADPYGSDGDGWSGGLARLKGGGREGQDAIRVTAASGQSGGYYGLSDTSLADKHARRFPIEAGRSYRVSAWVRPTYASFGGDIAIYFRLYSPDGSFTWGTPGNITGSGSIPANTWAKMSGVINIPETRTQTQGVIGCYVQADFNTGSSCDFTEITVTEMASGELIVDGSITAVKIKAKSITAGELAANAVTADKIDGGAIDGKVITGATVRTNSAGTGIIINNSGIEAKTSAGRQFLLSASTGNVTATGGVFTGSTFRTTSDSSRGIQMDKSYLRAWNSNSVETLRITASTGDVTMTGGKLQTVSTSNRGVKFDSSGFRAYDSVGNVMVDIGGSFNRFAGRIASGPSSEPGATILPSSEHGSGYSGYWLTKQAGVMGGSETAGMWLEKPKATIVEPLQLRGLNNGGVNIWGRLYAKDFYAGEILGPSAGYKIQAANGSWFNGSVEFNGRVLAKNTPSTTLMTNAHIAVDGTLYKSSSAARYKLFPRAMDESHDDKILSIEAKTWIDKHDAEATGELMAPETLDRATDPDPTELPSTASGTPLRRVPGVIAEEVRDAGLDEFVIYGGDGQVEGVMYERLGVALIPVVKRQRDRIIQLEAQVADQADALAALLARVEALEAA